MVAVFNSKIVKKNFCTPRLSHFAHHLGPVATVVIMVANYRGTPICGGLNLNLNCTAFEL